MRRFFSVLMLTVPLVYGERIVLRDNTVRVGKLSGIEGTNLVVVTVAGTERIPSASVTAILFDDAVPTAPRATSTGAVPSASPINPIAPIVSANTQTVEGLRVDLDRCTKQASTSVTCDLRVTNLTTDKVIELWIGPTFFVDADGMQRQAVMGTYGASQGDGAASTTAVTNITTKASLRFAGVEPGVNSLAKISMTWNDNGRLLLTEFRDVPLQGK